MSILDAFVILFKSQGTDEVKKSEDDLKKSGDNLNQSFKDTQNSSENLGDSIFKLGVQIGETLTAAISLGSVLAGIKNSINYAENLDLASRLLGVNVEQLDAWDNAVRRTGGTAEQFQNSLGNLAQRLGTSGQVALQVLPQLADSFQRMGRFAAIRYGETLGLDENTILLLRKGRAEVEAIVKQQKELGVVSKKDAEEARAFNFAWQDATHSLRMGFMEAAEAILPLITDIVIAFGKAVQFLTEHADLVKGALIGIGIVVAALAAPIVIPFVLANAAVIAVTAGIVALIAAFALVYEDIKYFIEGNDSLIGHILKKWPEVGNVIESVFHGILESINAVIDAFDKVKSYISDFTSKKVDIGVGFMQNSNAQQNISGLQQAIVSANASPLNAQTSNSIFNSNSKSANRNVSVNTGPITINTQATDSDGVAQAFGYQLYEQITQANNYFDDGVSA